MSDVAIIGGTGFSELPQLQITRSEVQSTRFGDVPLDFGLIGGQEIVFLPRHGRPANKPPHKINYRANVQALSDLKVTKVISLAAVGSVDAKLGVGSIVMPDQIIDYTTSRINTFFGDEIHHIDFTYPFDEKLRLALAEVFTTLSDIEFHHHGTYGCTEGPRLETAAEIRRMNIDGCTIVGMTGMPEAALVRERDMAYANISMVVNAGAGLNHQIIDLEAIYQVMNQSCADVARGLERYFASQ